MAPTARAGKEKIEISYILVLSNSSELKDTGDSNMPRDQPKKATQKRTLKPKSTY